jgi:predicted dehydrogenase
MKIGIVGAGAITRRGHLPTYGTLPQIEVIAIADTNGLLAQKVAEEFGIPKYCTGIKELLEDNSIQLIDVCTPPQSHLEIIKLAAAKGKHILVEKPLAISLEDALLIKESVNQNKVKACLLHNWRYFSSIIAAKERISRGYLGRIVNIHGSGLTSFPSNWTLASWPYHRGGALYDFTPHVVDMILWIKDFSPVKRVYASGGDFSQGNMDFINYAVINMEFEDGSIATCDISWISGIQLKFTLDICGTAGDIFIDLRNDVSSETRGFPTPIDDVKFVSKKILKIGTGLMNGSFFKGANIGFKPIISQFVNSINGDGNIPIPIDQGVMTNAILAAAQVSIEQHKSIDIQELVESKRVGL